MPFSYCFFQFPRPIQCSGKRWVYDQSPAFRCVGGKVKFPDCKCGSNDFYLKGMTNQIPFGQKGDFSLIEFENLK
jgi:hypothetical protein